MPQDYPFRLQVLRAITESLSQINPENGYVNDLSSAVFRGRLYFGENDPLPMVSILEPPLPPDPIHSPAGSAKQVTDWDMLVQGFVADDPVNPTDPAHVLLADVRRALALERAKEIDADEPNMFGMGRAVRSLHLGSPVVRPSDDISAKAYFYLPITIKVAEDLSDPYANRQP